MTTVELAQKQSLPKEDLRPYAGKWVALRDGRVVTSAVDAVSLRADPKVRERDTLLPVPSTERGLLFL